MIPGPNLPTTERHFADSLVEAAYAKKSILVAGLDPQLRYIPVHLRTLMANLYGKSFEGIGRLFLEFNKRSIDAIAEFAIAVKPQMAFYEAYGMWGIWAFEETVKYAYDKGLIVIEDAKRGDGGDTADAYADGHIGEVPWWSLNENAPEELSRIRSPLRVDAVTVHGYIGDDCVKRFVRPSVNKYGTGIFVVTKTSFKPNSRVEQLDTKSGLKVWQELAEMINEWGVGTEGIYGYRNVGAVMGATYPEDAPWMRAALPYSWLLVPGYGGQGGTADQAVAGARRDGLGCAVNSSRAITFAYMKGPYQTDPEKYADAAALAARTSRDELNEALQRAGKYSF
ncbi:orotidine-5'-phosphate decarboxylase [Candidatus Kaiserbacteria bacterium]|nr:orotidine-5'-phosphate decarboxylase [Candidatus Kaiserbacteria bacterium]